MKSLLDTVEPDAWNHIQGNYKEPSFRRLDPQEKSRGWTEESLYSSQKVESLLAECQKQTLLKAALWFEHRGFNELNNKGHVIGYAEDELRRMAEREE